MPLLIRRRRSTIPAIQRTAGMSLARHHRSPLKIIYSVELSATACDRTFTLQVTEILTWAGTLLSDKFRLIT